MQSIKAILFFSSLLLLTSCSKDDYGPREVTQGSSISYNSSSSSYGNTSSTTSPASSSTEASSTSTSTPTSSSTETSSTETSSTETSSTETSSTETSSTETSSTESSSTESSSTETSSTETSSTETSSTETSSTETSSTESSSTETSSTESSSTETSLTYSISVSAQSSSNYILSGTDLNGAVNGNDPNITINKGDTINFNVAASGHPFFLIKNSNGGFGSDNLIEGVSNNGAENGTISWTSLESGTYYYICEYHPSMIGIITVNE
jgi:plastocyanin